MSITIGQILEILDKILRLEKKAAAVIASEKDVRKREKYEKAFKNRDRDAIAALLFEL